MISALLRATTAGSSPVTELAFSPAKGGGAEASPACEDGMDEAGNLGKLLELEIFAMLGLPLDHNLPRHFSIRLYTLRAGYQSSRTPVVSPIVARRLPRTCASMGEDALLPSFTSHATAYFAIC